MIPASSSPARSAVPDSHDILSKRRFEVAVPFHVGMGEAQAQPPVDAPATPSSDTDDTRVSPVVAGRHGWPPRSPAARAVASLLDDAQAFADRASSGSFLLPHRVDPAEFFSWEEENRLLNLSGASRHLAKDGVTIPNPSMQRILRDVPAGATLQIEHAELYSPVLAAICGELSVALGGEYARCNVYMAPSHEHTAFDVHHDVVDAFIVQISGAKRWKVWEQTLPDPVYVMRSHKQDVSSTEPALDVVLTPGDVLFLRRGDPHLVQCHGQAASLHLTIGVQRTTGDDLMQILLEDARELPRFRRSWPLIVDGGDESPAREEFIAEFCAELARWVQDRDPAMLMRRVLNYRAAVGPLPGIVSLPGLADKAQLSLQPDSRVRLSHPRLRARLDGRTLYMGRQQIGLPPDAVPVVALLVARPSDVFSLVELRELDGVDQSRLPAIVGELVRVGLAALVESNALEL